MKHRANVDTSLPDIAMTALKCAKTKQQSIILCQFHTSSGTHNDHSLALKLSINELSLITTNAGSLKLCFQHGTVQRAGMGNNTNIPLQTSSTAANYVAATLDHHYFH